MSEQIDKILNNLIDARTEIRAMTSDFSETVITKMEPVICDLNKIIDLFVLIRTTQSELAESVRKKILNKLKGET